MIYHIQGEHAKSLHLRCGLDEFVLVFYYITVDQTF